MEFFTINNKKEDILGGTDMCSYFKPICHALNTVGFVNFVRLHRLCYGLACSS